jgi:hypothetical protein
MRIEEGSWSRTWWIGFPEDFSTRIVIERPEFERLNLAEFEKHDEFTPCLGWCHAHVDYGEWSTSGDYNAHLGSTSVQTYYVYFRHHEDAMAFYLRWA